VIQISHCTLAFEEWLRNYFLPLLMRAIGVKANKKIRKAECTANITLLLKTILKINIIIYL
jgi:hypothetical protein